MYEMRDDIPGVKFVKGGQAGWTPVQKPESGLDQAIDREEGNGTLTTPRRATIWRSYRSNNYVKEVAYLIAKCLYKMFKLRSSFLYHS